MEIKTIAVVGSGIMGNGIAQVAAMASYQVSIQDIAQSALDKALETIRLSLSRFVNKGKLDEQGAKDVLNRIQPTEDLRSVVSEADYVIEAVTEDLDLKLQVFEQIDRLAPQHAVIASNTSQYSITELASATNRPKQVIGTHFFNPPVIMRLIEVVRGLETSEETLQTTLEMARRMVKEVVVCKDSQGFITSRLINLWLTEAERIYEEGIATKEDIDKACRLGFNHPMGPFELDDFSGLDTRLNIGLALEKALGDRFKPTQILHNLVRAGRLGQKVGRGFYDHKGK
jgi:3-hydroxybutyryl-CoA dehydrogenase